jgi:hypothetical protein
MVVHACNPSDLGGRCRSPLVLGQPLQKCENLYENKLKEEGWGVI